MRIPARRLSALRRRLLAWYDAGHRALPWRFPQRGADPYRVWLAEAMLQQTQVRTVVPYYERFVARFPTLEALAAADEDEVLALWSGLGYYARGRNLLAAAREAVRRHGALPASREALRALPGFGPYTAGAVASIAFAIPAAAVDGNVARVLARVLLVEGDPAARPVRERLWAIAGELVGEGSRREAIESSRPGDLNQALMELGATVCRRAAPSCRSCPIARLCEAHAAHRAADLPSPRPRRARARMELACAVVVRGGAILLVRSDPARLLGGLWGPPAAPVLAGDDPARALAAGLRGHPSLPSLGVGVELAAVTRELTHRTLRLRAYACEGADAAPAGARWVPLDALHSIGMSTAMRALLAAALPARAGARLDDRRARPRSRTELPRARRPAAVADRR